MFADRFLEEGDQIAAEAGKAPPEKRRRHGISPRKRSFPWKTSSPRGVKRQNRDDLLRQKIATEAEIRKEELADKEAERKCQKEMMEKKLEHEGEEGEEQREYQREKDTQAADIRRAEIDLLKQTDDLLKQLVVTLVKKDL